MHTFKITDKEKYSVYVENRGSKEIHVMGCV